MSRRCAVAYSRIRRTLNHSCADTVCVRTLGALMTNKSGLTVLHLGPSVGAATEPRHNSSLLRGLRGACRMSAAFLLLISPLQWRIFLIFYFLHLWKNKIGTFLLLFIFYVFIYYYYFLFKLFFYLNYYYYLFTFLLFITFTCIAKKILWPTYMLLWKMVVIGTHEPENEQKCASGWTCMISCRPLSYPLSLKGVLRKYVVNFFFYGLFLVLLLISAELGGGYWNRSGHVWEISESQN